jgi:hypothetical protein
VEWFDCSIPLCPPGGLDSNKFDAMEDMFHIQVEDKIFGEDWLECFATEILLGILWFLIRSQGWTDALEGQEIHVEL